MRATPPYPQRVFMQQRPCQAAGCAEPASSTIVGAAARTLIRASVPERVARLLPSGVMGSAEFADTTGLARGEPHQDR